MAPDSPDTVSLTSARFQHFKALRDYSVSFGPMTVLVGPNNSGKSTVIASLRVLVAALRTARARKPQRIQLGDRSVVGYQIPEDEIPVSLVNVSSDYESREASVIFRFSNGNHLVLRFPTDGGCYLVPDAQGIPVIDTRDFARAFPFSLV